MWRDILTAVDCLNHIEVFDKEEENRSQANKKRHHEELKGK